MADRHRLWQAAKECGKVSQQKTMVDARMKKIARGLLLFLVLSSMPAWLLAQQPASPAATQAAPAAAAVPAKPGAAGAMEGIAPVDDAWRKALPKDPEQATQAYLARISPEFRARSDAYFDGQHWLVLWNLLYGLAMAWLLLARGRWAKVTLWAQRVTPRGFLSAMIAAAAYLLVTWVLSLPIAVYEGFFREHQYAMATQTFGPWFGEQLIGLGLGLVIGTPAIAVLYLILRRAGRQGWLWGAVAAIVINAFIALIGPVYIDPLFNTYKPLADGPVKESILSMARANGVPTDNVVQFDASRQTTRVSANVSGFMGTTSIRLNDNLLNTTLPEIREVMGHEMGHYVLNHTYKHLVYFGLLFAGGFAFMQFGYAGAVRRWGSGWNLGGHTDVAGLPLMVALLSVFMFVATPLTRNVIRIAEIEADIFGLNASREPDGFAETALKLGKYRKLAPGALEEIIFFDHPSGYQRIHMAMRWKAENPVRE
jgi:STE24 endopeptidase